jgi:TolA-binding protein
MKKLMLLGLIGLLFTTGCAHLACGLAGVGDAASAAGGNQTHYMQECLDRINQNNQE